MIWSPITRNGITLTHIRQEENTNQCVAASVGMIAQNANYWRKNENALFSYGASAMRTHNPGAFTQVNDRELINVNGIRSNAVAAYLRSYGWNVISLNATNAGNAAALVDRINSMQNYDSCILAAGSDQLHAFAAIKLGGTTYILNPALDPSENPDDALFTYQGNVVRIDPQNNTNVQFNTAASGNETYRSVAECYFIPSQYSICTTVRWMYRAIVG